MDRVLSRFSIEFLISQCILEPPASSGMDSDSESDDPSFRSGLASPSDSIASSVAFSLVNDVSYTAELGPGLANLELESSGDTNSETEEPVSFLPASRKAAIEKNLLMQIGYFATRATHVPHRKLGKLSRRVIIKVSKVLRDDPLSLEVVHDMVGRCHRTQTEGLLDRVLQARESTNWTGELDKRTATHRSSSKQRLYTDSRWKVERPTPTMQSDQLQRPSSHVRERSISPSSHGKTSPLPAALASTLAPLASSSLKGSVEKVRVQGSARDAKVRVQMDSGGKVKVQVGGVETEGAASLVSREERRRLGKQQSRGGGDGNTASEEFIPSDESFQSAVSELDVLDCSADTVLAPEGEGEEFVGAVGEESSASTSHDSRKSPDARKHNTSSGSSVERGVEPVGVVSGFHNKPGYMG